MTDSASDLHVWHLTADAPRVPRRVSAGERVTIHAGTWPIAAGQSVWADVDLGAGAAQRIELEWRDNEGPNSYWTAALGPFNEGTIVRYTLRAASGERIVSGSPHELRVGPKLHLALLWHQHQPRYPAVPCGAARQFTRPWVRLHALRDYFSMAALLAETPRLHATINLTPSLLEQLDDYVLRGASDRSLALTLKPAEEHTPEEREEIASSFFDADWHEQIFCHPRYAELFEQRAQRRAFATTDVRDLQMWFNLAWFGHEFRTGVVALGTGEHASVQRFVERGRGFSPEDLRAMVEEQYKVLRAIVPRHRALQERGQLEISTTPYYHPILPLLIDTDEATLDRAGATHPPRFAWPEDADRQLASACRAYRGWFGVAARGLWPAEGAVSERALGVVARAKLRWVATDQGVLARSGRFGYDTQSADVSSQARRTGHPMAIFFRDTELSDAIGFRYSRYPSASAAVADFVRQLRERFIERFAGDGDRLVTVILDGENAWGSYPDDGRPFLRALYRALARLDAEVRTVTFSEWLEGNAERGIPAHPIECLEPVCELFTGSWIDENGSAPGVDLGTWVGEPEENRAWALLGQTRRWLSERGKTPENAPEAFAALDAAEGSDWFWWYGVDQDSGTDGEFDAMFRAHLHAVYGACGAAPPRELELPIVPAAALWTFARPLSVAARAARLIVRTNCPGHVRWRLDAREWLDAPVTPVGGVMAGVSRHELVLGPFPADAQRLHFAFHCEHGRCAGRGPCCELGVREVELA